MVELRQQLFASACVSLRPIIAFGTCLSVLPSSSWPSVNVCLRPIRQGKHAYEHEWARLSQSLRDSPMRFTCISAEKRSDKGFLPLPRQRPLRWFCEALVFEAPKAMAKAYKRLRRQRTRSLTPPTLRERALA